MAACSVYGPRGSPSASARARAASPRLMWRRSQVRRSWSSSRTGAPDGPVRARRRDDWNSISATRPVDLGLLRRQGGEHPAEPEGFGAELGPQPVLAGGGGVPLVVDQVDHLEHRGQAGRPVRAVRDLEGDGRLGDRLLGADDALRDGRLRHHVGPGDLGHREPTDQAQRERRPGREATGPGGTDTKIRRRRSSAISSCDSGSKLDLVVSRAAPPPARARGPAGRTSPAACGCGGRGRRPCAWPPW